MSNYGKTIRIYLKDRTATGIKMCEIVNSTIQAVSCPRTRIAELRLMEEAQKPAVYFLFGQDDSSDRGKVYIGEAENVYQRLQQQLEKEFWNEVIFFGSKDLYVTKAHVKHLESKILFIAKEVDRYIVENDHQPQASSLSLPDVDAMTEFLENLQLMLGTLGHNVLEPILPTKTSTMSAKTPIAQPEAIPFNLNGTQLFLTNRNINARAVLTDEGIVVLTGSQTVLNDSASISFRYAEVRRELWQQGVLKPEGDHLVFTQDYLFKAASRAASVVVGTAINGKDSWKTADGRSLNDLTKEDADLVL